jgi:hypothetical protein
MAKIIDKFRNKGTIVIVKTDSPMLKLPTLPLLCDSAKLRGRRRARKAYPELVEGDAARAGLRLFRSRGRNATRARNEKGVNPLKTNNPAKSLIRRI